MSLLRGALRSLVFSSALTAAATPDIARAQIANVEDGLVDLILGKKSVKPCETTDGIVASCGSVDHILRAQRDLQALGLDPGPSDGIVGPATRAAIMAFLTYAGRAPSDNLSRDDDRLLAVSAKYFAISGRKPDAAAIRDLVLVIDYITNMASVQLGGSAVVAAALPTNLALPTRVFAGPGQFPPTGFRGYGFLAFKATAADFDFNRHMMICQAYMNTMQITGSATAPKGDQFVTVWPVVDRLTAAELNVPVPRNLVADRCKVAIDNYDLAQSVKAINAARASGAVLDGIGPYLFGWIPAEEFGAEGSLILMVDLSRIEVYDQALALFESWKTRIETDPALIRDGLSVEGIRMTIRDWADQHGTSLLSLLGAD